MNREFHICRNSLITETAIDQKAMVWSSPLSEWFQDSNNPSSNFPEKEAQCLYAQCTNRDHNGGWHTHAYLWVELNAIQTQLVISYTCWERTWCCDNSKTISNFFYTVAMCEENSLRFIQSPATDKTALASTSKLNYLFSSMLLHVCRLRLKVTTMIYKPEDDWFLCKTCSSTSIGPLQ